MSHSNRSHSNNLHQLAELVDALCEGEISQTQLAQLEELLHNDAGARNFYIDHMRLVAELEWQQVVGDVSSLHAGDLPPSTENIREMLEEDEAAEKRKAEELAKIESLAAEKFLAFRREQERHAEPVPAPRNAFFASIPWVAAAAIVFILWMLPDPVPVEPVPVVVASIHDSIDARWSDPSISADPGTQLSTLENLVLTRGIVEIAFEGGARAVIEAPSTLELLSPDSARLEWGKLVGRVPRSEVHLTIKTPQATITDLGTEFGVEVNRQQVTHLHVFEGRVSAATLDAEGKTAQQQTVLVDEAVYLRPKTGAIEPASTADADRFVRHVPIPMPRYSTGVDLAAGDADPNWRIVAAENDPDFVPRQAIVAPLRPAYVSNDPRQSQWVSPAAEYAKLPSESQYTFRMTWTLTEVRPNRLRGSFRADDLVTAIRINGVEVPTPKHKPGSSSPRACQFSIEGRHLKAGENVIEFDVRNAGGRGGAVGKKTPLALWVRWKGGS